MKDKERRNFESELAAIRMAHKLVYKLNSLKDKNGKNAAWNYVLSFLAQKKLKP
jgi:hypothetical protein